jgi:hypothetical protein
MSDKTNSAIVTRGSAHPSEDAVDRRVREIAEARESEEPAQRATRAVQQRQQQQAAVWNNWFIESFKNQSSWVDQRIEQQIQQHTEAGSPWYDTLCDAFGHSILMVAQDRDLLGGGSVPDAGPLRASSARTSSCASLT